MSYNSTHNPTPKCLLALCVFAMTVLGTWMWISPQKSPRKRTSAGSSDGATSRLAATSVRESVRLKLLLENFDDVNATPLVSVQPLVTTDNSSTYAALASELRNQQNLFALKTRSPIVVAPQPRVASRFQSKPLLPMPQLDLGPQNDFASLRLAIPHVPNRSTSSTEKLILSNALEKATPFQVERKFADDLISPWPYPTKLMRKLDALSAIPSVTPLMRNIRDGVAELRSTGEIESYAAADAIRGLRMLSAELSEEAEASPSPQMRIHLRSLRYELEKRLAVWQQIYEISSQATFLATYSDTDPQFVLAKAAQLRSQMSHDPQQMPWVDYLLLDGQDTVHGQDGQISVEELTRWSRRTLLKMQSLYLKPDQLSYLSDEQFREFAAELRYWARQPLDYANVLETIERYEQDDNSRNAERVAELAHVAHWAQSPELKALGQTVTNHYRNANVRIAVSKGLLDRVLPATTMVKQTVNDMVLGAQVRGSSFTNADVKVQLYPSEQSWRFGFLASGMVKSKTESEKWPAKFYNHGCSKFMASKGLMIDRHGVKVTKTKTNVSGSNRLVGMETEFDSIPLIGDLVRSVARQQHDSQAGQARQIMRQKVAFETNNRLDEEIHTKLRKAEDEFATKVLGPMHKLRLNPIALDMNTSEDRLVSRYRIAGDDQLGAHTTRPRAFSNSLVSVQLHQSAINNVLHHLKFDGREMTLPELWTEMQETFSQSKIPVPEELPTDVSLRFAKLDAVRVEFAEDRAQLTIKLAELKKGNTKRWKNVMVRAYYRPDFDAKSAELKRDGIVEFLGKRFGIRDQLALRMIFSKVLEKDRAFPIISQTLIENARMKDVQLSQFEIRDGWIGVAMAPAGEPNPPGLALRTRTGRLDPSMLR